MNRPKFLLYPLALLGLSAGIAWASSTTLTSYYPSPTGYYNFLYAQNVGIGTTVSSAPLNIEGGSDGTAFQTNCGTESASCPAWSASGYGITLDSDYKDGRYRYRLESADRGGNVSLYVQDAVGVANSYINVARFGTNQFDNNSLAVFGNQYVSGNVGIGSPNPAALLNVFGTGQSPSTTSNTAIFQIGNNITQALAIGADPNSPYDMWFQTKRSDNDGSFWPIDLNPLGGNVGINITSPGYQLEVKGNTSNFYAVTNPASAAAAQQITVGEKTDNPDYRLALGYYLDNSAGWEGVIQATQNSSGAPLSINPIGGNVGIGATVPNARLDVKGIGNTNATFGFGVRNSSDIYSVAVTDANNVGIGVTTPLAKLDVVAANSLTTNDLQFSWNSSGQYVNGIANHMDGGLASDNQMTFLVSNASPTAQTSVMTLLGNGHVGIGVTNPSTALSVNGAISINGAAGGYSNGLLSGNGDGTGFDTNDIAIASWYGLGFGTLCPGCNTTGHAYPISFNLRNGDAYFYGNLQVNGQINANGIVCSENACPASDRRLKRNIIPLTGALSKIDQLRGVSFEWNHLAASRGLKEGEKHIGMIAQELQKVYPELVKQDNKGYLSIDYDKFTAVLLQSVKELKSQMNAMQDQINALQEKVKTLEKQK